MQFAYNANKVIILSIIVALFVVISILIVRTVIKLNVFHVEITSY